MNTSLTTLFTAIVAVFASAVLALSLAEVSDAAQPQPAVVKLARVVVVGKRLNAEAKTAQQIEKLPRVVIISRRADAPVQVAGTCSAQSGC